MSEVVRSTESSGYSSSPLDSFVTSMQNDSSLGALESLLQDKISRRTFQLLSRVVQSRVLLQWVIPLLEYRRNNAPSSYQDNEGGDVVDGTGPRPESRLPEIISNTAMAAAVDLVNTFESRYAEGYRSLVTDALHVYNSTTSNSPTTTSSSSDEGELDLSPFYSVSRIRKQWSCQSSCSLNTPAPCQLQAQYSLSYKNARDRYIGILHSLFVQQINWGRIVAMMSFLRALCEVIDASAQSHASSSSSEDVNEVNSPPPPLDKTDFASVVNQSADGDEDKKLTMKIQDRRMASLHYIVWTTEFIHKESKVGDWIEEHGSWEGLEAFVKAGKSSQLASLLFGFSVFLLGPVGFACAIAFALRRFWS